MITKDKVITFLKQYKEEHIEDYHLRKIGIFGSIAREDNHNLSDIDVVVEFSKPNLFIQAGIMEDLKEYFKTDVDVIALSNQTNPKLLKRINQDVIYV
jgi:predicted nucleotidyltransferase